MNKVLSILTFFFSIVILFSCEPNRDTNGDYLIGVNQPGGNGGGSGGGPSTGRLLKKMLSHSLDDNGQFEDSEVTYNYEGNKLVSYVDESGESTLFTYNSNNKISKLSGSGQDAVFTYSGADLSKINVTVAGVYTVNTDFTYVGTQLKKAVSIQEFTLPIPSKVYIETDYEYSGENMVKASIKGGFYLPNGDLQMNPEVQTFSFQYDTKKNPYQLLPKEFFIYLSGIAPQGAAFLSANNMIKVTQVLDVVTEVTEYSYTYDSENYPIKMSGADDEYTIYQYQ
ncbi:hypothetical protein [Kaistella jeonii]|uniref:DUF4595 domain-containing protein n=1 Tax=Kaistella jeonii TaxID=266749 RepID=A0A0C1CZT9_9FLAO|nr:hypothetical protein [Kaistella jeonii]KIA89946.1 hypothetical protein OA86_04910 [Kaistella jeonii]SFB80533.1 hypothetical protein SAMN05421876_102315 [Kaistella jeonii]VEI96201.1 Uncharacterised protein [Kaistella jeonii]